MANTPLPEWEKQIKAICQKAYDAGFAAAMEAIREFADVAAPGARRARGAEPARPRARKSAAMTPSRRSRAMAKEPSLPRRPRLQRGSSALLIAEVLKAMPHPTRASDIRRALQHDKAVSISFPSIRRGLDQLAQRGQVEMSPDRRTWRYTGERH